MIDNKTQNYLIPLPDKNNLLSEDVDRLKQGLIKIDSVLKQKMDETPVSSAIDGDSETKIASEKAVKKAAEKGINAQKTANEALKIAQRKQDPATTLAGYGIIDAVTKADFSKLKVLALAGL